MRLFLACHSTKSAVGTEAKVKVSSEYVRRVQNVVEIVKWPGISSDNPSNHR